MESISWYDVDWSVEIEQSEIVFWSSLLALWSGVVRSTLPKKWIWSNCERFTLSRRGRPRVALFISFHFIFKSFKSFNAHHHLSAFVLITTENTLIFLGSTRWISVVISLCKISTPCYHTFLLLTSLRLMNQNELNKKEPVLSNTDFWKLFAFNKPVTMVVVPRRSEKIFLFMFSGPGGTEKEFSHQHLRHENAQHAIIR